MSHEGKTVQANSELQVAKAWLDELLEHGVENPQKSHLVDRLRAICQQATDMGDSFTSTHATVLSALVHYENNEFERVLASLESVRRQLIENGPVEWYGVLTSATSVLQSYAAAQEARGKIESTLLELTDEIKLLEIESKNKIEKLWRALLDTQPGEPYLPESLPTKQADQQPDLRVQLLGRFHAARGDGRPIELCPNRKGQAIFRLMTTDATGHYHRERLLNTFWRDEDPATAMGKLHVAISRLRRSLVAAGFPEDILQFADDSYFFMNGLTIQTDLDQFSYFLQAGQRMEAVGEVALAIDEYEAAGRLYRGDYLDDLVGEEWPLPTRVKVEQDYLELLDRLASCYYRCERYQESEEACRRLLAYDNLREDIYRHLMRCLSRLGQRAQALKLYQELKELLQAELGVMPTGSTTKLMLRIKEEQEV